MLLPQAQFDATVERMCAPPERPLLAQPPPPPQQQRGAAGSAALPPPPPLLDAAAFVAEVAARVAELEAATEGARQANIGVAKAKRVLKELQAQVGWWAAPSTLRCCR